MLTLDVYADVVCPWCYLGAHRLQQALRQVQAENEKYVEVVLRWRPFQLQPQIPETGLPWRRFAEQKFGGWDRAQAAFRHVQKANQEDGLRFNFDRIATAPNTVDAHRLILFAEKHGLAWTVAETLFAAYFTHGADLNDRDLLAQAAEQAGLDGAAARTYLKSELGTDEVEQSQEQAHQLGIGGVPFYVLGTRGDAHRYGLSGAQPASTLAAAVRQTLAYGPDVPSASRVNAESATISCRPSVPASS